jgi:WD40 repeat protein
MVFMAQKAHIFRVFVSSTFSDMAHERNALQTRVFPDLRNLCSKHGTHFQAIDLRWGISQEASLDQRAARLCLNEIARCQHVTRYPNFILLMGDRYGWQPLPETIPADEFAALESQLDAEKLLLHEWYKCDENAVPVQYVLQTRQAEYVDYARWNAVEKRLRDAFIKSLPNFDWTAERCIKYETSITEQEIIAGIFDNPYATQGAFCFFRTIEGLPDEASVFADADMQAASKLTDLKLRLRKHLPDNIHDYQTQWVHSDISTQHIDQFCEDVYARLSQAILAEIAAFQDVSPLTLESEIHQDFMQECNRHFVGQADVLQRVEQYRSAPPARDISLHTNTKHDASGTSAQPSLFAHLINRLRNTLDAPSAKQITTASLVVKNHPLVVHGQSGVGKSTVMARAIHDTPDPIYRFVGMTPESSDIRRLLMSVCQEIAIRYQSNKTIPQDYDELIAAFSDFLALASDKKPIVIFLDALDQLLDIHNPANLRWLPYTLPTGVKLILSAIPSPILAALEKRYPASFIEVQPMQQEVADRLLTLWLKDAQRTLTPPQYNEILSKFAQNGLPLYLKLAFEEARLWRSYDYHTLHADVISVIRDNLFARLSSPLEHGELLISRSMGYLSASRDGLSEEELLEILALDETYWSAFSTSAFHAPIGRQVPIILWSRLAFDLAPYLIEHDMGNVSLFTFNHHQFGEVVDHLYLDQREQYHTHLAKYFESQPLHREGVPSIRKVHELAYQQANAKLHEAYVTTLTDYAFLKASLYARSVQDLIEDCGLWSDETVRLIQSALRMSTHVLAYNKAALASHLVGRLMGHRHHNATIRTLTDWIVENIEGVYPANLDSKYGVLTQAGGALLRVFAGHTKPVGGALELKDGRFLSWSDDHTLRLWNSEGELLQTMQRHSFKVSGVLLFDDGRFLSWSVKADPSALLLWDADGQLLRTLQGHSSNITGALALPDGRILTWSDDKTLRLWDKHGEPLRTLRGHRDAVSGALALTDGRILSWGNGIKDYNLRLWSSNGERLRTLQGHSESVKGALVLPDRRILSWSLDHTLRVWDNDGRLLHTAEGHSGAVRGALALTNGGFLSWDSNHDRRLWDANGQLIHTMRCHKLRGALMFSDDRSLLWNRSGQLLLCAPDGQLLHTYAPSNYWHPYGIGEAQKLAEDRFLSWNEFIYFWNTDGQRLDTLQGHSGEVTGVLAVSAYRNRILSWSTDGTLRLWELEKRQAMPVDLMQHTLGVAGIKAINDGRVLSWGSWDQEFMLWSPNGEFISNLPEDYRDGDRDNINDWLKSYGINHNDVYPEAQLLPNLTDVGLRKRDDRIEMIDANDGKVLSAFIADANLTTKLFVFDSGVFVAGDAFGRVLFLRYSKGKLESPV